MDGMGSQTDAEDEESSFFRDECSDGLLIANGQPYTHIHMAALIVSNCIHTYSHARAHTCAHTHTYIYYKIEEYMKLRCECKGAWEELEESKDRYDENSLCSCVKFFKKKNKKKDKEKEKIP